MQELTIALTVRVSSERFVGKEIEEIENKPRLVWTVDRLNQTGANVVVATSTKIHNDVIENVCNSYNIPCVRFPGDEEDVVGRMMYVADIYKPKYLMRALGDCPFIAPEIIVRAAYCLERWNKDAFLWMLSPETLPVYGAREFPYAMKVWRQMDKYAKGEERMHTDLWFNRNREKFDILFHYPPTSDYFRVYRLEIDYPEDLDMVRQIAQGPGMMASIPEVNRFLDVHPEIVKINATKEEKTGPFTTNTYKERREWFKVMKGKPVVDWNNKVWQVPDDNATPIFCSSGKCLLGYGHSGRLYMKDGHIIIGTSMLACSCGAGKIWKSPK